MAKTIKITKSLADQLRQLTEAPRSSLFFTGKNNNDIITRIFRLPKDGGCAFTQAVDLASMAKGLLSVYKAELIPSGFFLIPTNEAFAEAGVASGALAKKTISKTNYLHQVIRPIFTSDLEFIFIKFAGAPAIVVCEHALYAGYSNNGKFSYLKIKEV
jgi:hypothetical protein